jgi:choline dehydrogenase
VFHRVFVGVTGPPPFPVNIDGVTRINSAFGYVDPVRDRLVVAGDALVERVLVRGGRAVGVAVRDGRRLAEIGVSRVVLSAGAYWSPTARGSPRASSACAR